MKSSIVLSSDHGLDELQHYSFGFWNTEMNEIILLEKEHSLISNISTTVKNINSCIAL